MAALVDTNVLVYRFDDGTLGWWDELTVLVDTNVLVYRFDGRFPDKQRTANGILRRVIVEDSVRLPHQAILEFVAAVTRPIRGHVILKQSDALREAEEFLKQFSVLYPNEAILRNAIRGCAAYQLDWFDAQIWFTQFFSTIGSMARFGL